MTAQDIAKQLRDMAELAVTTDSRKTLNAAADIADKHVKMRAILFSYSENTPPGEVLFKLLTAL